MGRSHVQRMMTNIVRAFTTKHETFATFLSEPLDGLQRWQSAFCARFDLFAHISIGGAPAHQQLTLACSATPSAQCL
jgi:hypothetical protein